jgi:hypothetical protein
MVTVTADCKIQVVDRFQKGMYGNNHLTTANMELDHDQPDFFFENGLCSRTPVAGDLSG